jgi:type IV secretory pathway VirB10-like protein
MSTSRTLIRAAVVVGVIAVGAAVFLRGGPDEEETPSEEQAAPDEPVLEEPEPGAAKPTPAPRAAAPAAPSEPAPPANPSTGPVDDQDGGPPPPLEGDLREHAILMLTPLAKQAMDMRDLEQLRAVLQQVKERKAENLMAAHDVEGLEIAVACLEGGAEAREEANDFIQFGTPTSYGDSLRTACSGEKPKP